MFSSVLSSLSLPIHLQNRYTRYSTTHSTRRTNTFVMVQARTNIKAMCLSYGVKLRNSVSTNLRDCNGVIIVRKNLKKFLFQFTSNCTSIILGGCPFNGPLSGTKYPTRAASPIQNASTPKSSLPFSKHRSCALLCAVVRRF